MKSKIVLSSALIIMLLSACTKCVTCTAYYTAGYYKGQVDKVNQAVKVCDKADINAYENGTNYTDPSAVDTIRYICK
jgi:hypothetical protein